MKIITFIRFAILASIISVAAVEAAFNEGFRPQFHFTPKQQWMNDPNGLVYLDGEYHLFFQYYPYSNVWGPMHWGHAISKDLVHWNELPIALFPDNNGSIFSGSAVYDQANTSGLGTKENPPLVAIFTYHNHMKEQAGEPFYQTQGLAFSVDKGRTWQKYANNPILKSDKSNDFRDPKVFWYETSKKWIMSLAVKNKISFYSSKDLKNWEYESDFGETIGAHAGVWECPDLILMPVVNAGVKTKYVLFVSINPGGINGGSATQYFVGDFDGHAFTLDKKFSQQLKRNEKSGFGPSIWLDYGRDNYAGATWSNLPAVRHNPVVIGWMNNWDYGSVVPTKTWRSAMTMPRELQLVDKKDGFSLLNFPVRDHADLAVEKKELRNISITNASDLAELLGVNELPQHISLTIDIKKSKKIDVILGNDKEAVKLSFDKKYNKVIVDRDKSGLTDFSAKFVGVQTAPFIIQDNTLELDFYLDKSSLEIFINKGELSFTNQIFPTSLYKNLLINSDNDVFIHHVSFESYRSALAPK